MGDYLQKFERHLRHEKCFSERTIETYLKSINALYKESREEILNLKTYNQVRDLIVNISDKRKWADRTTYKAACEASVFYNWAFREGIIEESPMRLGHSFKRAEKKQMDFFDWDSEDFKKLVYNPNNSLRDNAIMHSLRSAGLRASALCNLRIKEVDLKERWFFIKESKGGDYRYTPFDEETKTWLSLYIPQVKLHSNLDYLFQRDDFTKPLNPSYLYKILYRKAQKLGIKANPQKFRRSLGGELIARGADITIAQKTLGHKRASTTADYYVYFKNERLKNQYDKFMSA